MKIYFGCSLTHAPDEYRQLMEQLVTKIKEKYQILDFVGLEKGTAADVFKHDADCVKNCDLFVAECSYPATGVGMEIGLALSIGKPTLILAQKEAKVTRQVLGIEHEQFSLVRYNSLEEALDAIDQRIDKL